MSDDRQKRFNEAVKRIENSPESRAVFDACKRADVSPLCLSCATLRADNERLTRERNEANKDATHCLEQLSLVCIERDQLREQLAAANVRISKLIENLEALRGAAK